MRQKVILSRMSKGGRIVNHMFVNPDDTIRKDKITDRQITALMAKGLVTKTVSYDNTRTYRAVSP